MDELLACMRIESLPKPHIASHRDICSECGWAVWRAGSSPSDALVICLECLEERLKFKAYQSIEVMPLTEEQLKEIKHARRRQH